MPSKVTDTAVLHLVMYGRSGCHLCDDMRDALDACRDSISFTLEFRDIDADPTWTSQYRELIPVLMLDDQEICHYFLDKRALLSHFRARA